MDITLSSDIKYLKGVGPKRAECYNKLSVNTVKDLIYHFPRGYIDLTSCTPIKDACVGEICAVAGRIAKKLPPARIRKGMTIFKAVFTDDEEDMTVVIYNSEYLFNSLSEGEPIILYGKISGNLVRKEISSPTVFKIDASKTMQPVYPVTEGLSQTLVRSTVQNALSLINDRIYEPVPKDILKRMGLCSLAYALYNIHFPPDEYSMRTAKRRLVFDEFLTLGLGMMLLRGRNREKTPNKLYSADLKEFYKNLSFELTACQKRSIKECVDDMQKDRPMSRLLQGDVGSGKTVVAAALAYFVFKNKKQTALMAPTEILASQHYDTLREFLEPLGVKVGLLTGSVSAKEKKILYEKISAGDIDVVVGTQALYQQSVEFCDLALVITDEQHRFGVEQRASLSKKGENPHILVMSATPIPRTLALMIYGDLDISVLNELPKGRQRTETYAVTGKLRQRAFGFIKGELDKGRQAYIVCPVIEDNEQDLKSVKSYANELSQNEFFGYSLGLLHGKMKPKEKEEMMLRFKSKELQVLISTTVVEVGVDVKNATVILIENSERFGLSQLHQLRGRVGRGSEKSYCILVTDSPTEECKKRLKIMSKISDGFELSREDLKMRGPGDFFGSAQHGLPKLKIADMSEDMEVLQKAQLEAQMIYESDPELSEPHHKGLKAIIKELFERRYD